MDEEESRTRRQMAHPHEFTEVSLSMEGTGTCLVPVWLCLETDQHRCNLRASFLLVSDNIGLGHGVAHVKPSPRYTSA